MLVCLLLGVIQTPPTLHMGHTYTSITDPNATSLTFSVVMVGLCNREMGPTKSSNYNWRRNKMT